ncbi:MAG: DUF2268 domain-containing putative Zn-dependent protease [Rikenellaceae bacterium]|nr:DUF2268 domain-containing putative Zn-dependent protease [Rikenellaceae bacterium]
MKTVKLLCLLFALAADNSLKSQDIFQKHDLKIINISTYELKMLNQYKDSSIDTRNRIFTDSIYTPNIHLWEGYVGEANNFLYWVNQTAYKELDELNQKEKTIDIMALNNYFAKTIDKMTEMTGYSPKGVWYIFYGPKWMNLGGIDDGTMLIDLAHKANKCFDDIAAFFPHEINHQIFNNINPYKKNTVINRIVDEGFACYVSYLYKGKKSSVAQELCYTEKEFQTCVENEREIFALIKENRNSKERNEIEKFGARRYKFKEEYPGAIGYYIGFRIVEEYVKKYGKDSWKDLYTKDPETVFLESEILK